MIKILNDYKLSVGYRFFDDDSLVSVMSPPPQQKSDQLSGDAGDGVGFRC